MNNKTGNEMMHSHIEFMRKMADATIGTDTYHIFANEYDRLTNEFITKMTPKQEAPLDLTPLEWEEVYKEIKNER